MAPALESCWNDDFTWVQCCETNDTKCWIGDAAQYHVPCCFSHRCPIGIAFKTIWGVLLCLRTNGQVLDDTVLTAGSWPDCEILNLAQLWLPSTALDHGRQGPYTFLDVGANIGVCSVLASFLGWRTYAIEPLFEHLELLRASLSLNGLNADVIQAAAVAEPGFVFLANPWRANKYVNNTGATRVVSTWAKGVQRAAGIRLDSLPVKSIDFMKVDVEGFEKFAMEGARGFLGDPIRRPLAIFFELNTKLQQSQGAHPLAPLILLSEYGYRFFPHRIERTGMRGSALSYFVEGEIVNLTTYPEYVGDVLALVPSCVESWMKSLSRGDRARVHRRFPT